VAVHRFGSLDFSVVLSFALPAVGLSHGADEESVSLAQRFSLLGIHFQYWMPLVTGLAAAYIVYLWKTRQF
jgi:hypothetical protein